MMKKYFVFLLCICSVSLFCMAEEAKMPPPPTPPQKSGEINPADIITKEHTIKFGSETLNYESQVGTLAIKGEDGKDKAQIFFTAYLAKDAKGCRPITFCFNGGPGSASIWLHIGFLGPKKVVIQDEKSSSPPVEYRDNPFSLLKVSDLVFIDPVSAGFSKPVDGIDPKTFHGVEEDMDSFANFIRSFLTHSKKWDCPKYVLGESYGTVRAVGIAEKLFDDYCISLNGLILVSSILDYETCINENDLAFSLEIPTYAATAWYHKKLAPELQEKSLDQLLKEVQEFVSDDLITSYFQGDTLSSENRQAIAQRLSYYTGLSKTYILRDDLRVPSDHFFKELLRDEGKVLGFHDTRYVAEERNGNGEVSHMNPSNDFICGQFTAAHQALLLNELGWNKNEPYKVFCDKVFPWKWEYKSPGWKPYTMNLLGTLNMIMTREPNLKVFLVEGYYDLVTPYFAADYCFSHLFLPPGLEKNISIHTYKSGHMPYLHEESCKTLSLDLEKFMASPKEEAITTPVQEVEPVAVQVLEEKEEAAVVLSQDSDPVPPLKNNEQS